MQQGRILLGFGVEPAAGVGQVRTIESGDVHFRSAQPEHANDVVANVGRGGRGQGDGRGRTHLLAHFAQAHVFRAEVVSPEAEAVGFVDHQQVRTKLRQQALERRRRKALRREIEQSGEILPELLPVRATARPTTASCSAAARERPASCNCWTWSAMSEISGETTTVRPFSSNGRKLEAEAFARAGRHDADDVVAREHVLDDLALMRTELRKPKSLLQQIVETVHSGGLFSL